MHELFAQVLSKKDLSKAGDLFSLADETIEQDLVEIVQEIKQIADTEDYKTNSNDQSVVEICITRITTAIRETEKIEKHAGPLVDLLAMCHKHDLTQVVKDEDPPHAKIATDIMSRLFTYYSNRTVMELAIPAVVKFLDCDNKDLVRSVASYLSLAAIENASMLGKHMPLILSSVLKGNYGLGRLMPQIYSQNSEPVHERLDELAQLLDHCDPNEKVWFIQLFGMVATTKPELLEKHVAQLCSYLSSSSLAVMALMTLKDMALARPHCLVDHISELQVVSETQHTHLYQVVQIVGAVGTVSQEEGEKGMRFLVSQLSSSDQSILPVVLQEIRGLGQVHHALLVNNLEHVNKLSTSGSSAVRLMVEQIRDDVRKYAKKSVKVKATPVNSKPKPTYTEQGTNTTSSQSQAVQAESTITTEVATETAEPTEQEKVRKEMRSVSSQTEGTVTIITVGNPPNATHPSGTVSVKSTGVPPDEASSEQSLAKNSRSPSGDNAYSPTHSQTPETNSSSTVGPHASHNLQTETTRDGVQLFCEKHFAKIKSFISKLNATIPLPVKCSVVSGKHKRYLRLHFECACQSEPCLYSGSHFTLSTRLPKLWVHLMFLSVQAQSQCALSQRDPDVSCLKACWDALKGETSSSFLALVTSSFPTQKDQLALLQELHQMRYFDVFELNAANAHWACFVCNHPEKLSELLNDGFPEMAGQLKEKKGKWKFFKRWKTRYFTLSGGSFTYNKSNSTKATLPVTKIQSVKAVRKGIRDIPKAFEIFTDDQTYVFKAKGHHNVEQWVQCLHIAVARSQSTGSTTPSLIGAQGRSGVGDRAGLSTMGAVGGNGGAGSRASRRSERASAYSELFDPPLVGGSSLQPTVVELSSHGGAMQGPRVVTDTKL